VRPAPALPHVTTEGSHRTGVAVGGWVALIGAASVRGVILVARDPRITLPAPPLLASVEPGLDLRALPAMVLAGAAVVWAPRLADRLPWRRLLGAAFLGSMLWAVALALTEGPDGLIRSVQSPYDYRHDIHLVGHPGVFLDTFTERVDRYTTHVRGHPPGITLLAWSLERAGLGGPWPLAALFVAGGSLAAPAALAALGETAGREAARRAAPFVALAPASIWIATSGDALFAGVSAWAAALVVVATGRSGRRADGTALAGGVLFGLALNLSYGVLLVAAVPVVVASARRTVRPVMVAAGAALAVLGLVALAGFWWVDGLLATRAEYLQGVNLFRPYGYFLVANLASLALATGPALAAALISLRDRGVWLLVAGGLVAVALADLSGLSKAETERIWLPFMPWLLVAAAVLPHRRRWLAAQMGLGLGLELLLRVPW
jgi:methylthioxylose transferase